VGLAESNGSLQPTARFMTRITGISSETLHSVIEYGSPFFYYKWKEAAAEVRLWTKKAQGQFTGWVCALCHPVLLHSSTDSRKGIQLIKALFSKFYNNPEANPQLAGTRAGLKIQTSVGVCCFLLQPLALLCNSR